MSLLGKTYLVTGSTDGIGRHTAALLARQGANILIHGRNAAKVDDTVASLAKLGAAGTIYGAVADLSCFEEVRSLADQVHNHLKDQKLTALVNNAGVFAQQKEMSVDGLELTFAVNNAAPFLLTSLLLQKDAIAERIVNVASISASSSIDFHNLQQEKGYSSHGAYSNSKLCNIMFSFELAKRLAAAGSLVSSNALDPGTVNTKMLYAGWGPIGMRLEDANDEFHACTRAGLGTGKYFVGGVERRAPGPANDTEAREKLWNILCEQTGADWTV